MPLPPRRERQVPPLPMDFHPPLVSGRLVTRYKRFLADVRLDDPQRTLVTAHCANSGSMRGLCTPEAPVWLSPAAGKGRRLAWTWELVQDGHSWVGVHTGRANALVGEALTAQRIPALAGGGLVQAEVSVAAGTRLDFRLDGGGSGPPCFVEVKSVTLLQEPGVAAFPDAVTLRGRKHLETLAQLAQNGARAVILYVVQRNDCQRFMPAAAIDPNYAATLRTVMAAGVEALVAYCRVSPLALTLERTLPWEIPPSW
ncbi:MAG: DNA/RNA nuclease SfsA [Magnetococcus sp. WYHC-3]